MNWIKLNRSLLESECFINPITLKIWVWLLLKANHKDCTIGLKIGRGTTELKVKRSQLIFGRFKAEEQLGIDGSTIYKHINKLEKSGNITIESNNHYSVITICNYDSYQEFKKEKEQPSSSKVTAKEQQSNSQVTHTIIPKNDNKNKEYNNTYRAFEHLILTKDEFDTLRLRGYSKDQIDDTCDSIENYKDNKKYKSLFLTLGKWMKKEYGKQVSTNVKKNDNGPGWDNSIENSEEIKEIV